MKLKIIIRRVLLRPTEILIFQTYEIICGNVKIFCYLHKIVH